MSKCPNCKAELAIDHAFCPKCGFDLRIKKADTSNKVSNPEEIPELNKEDPELTPPPIEESTQKKVSMPTYMSAIKTTFIWSIVLSIVTVILYFLKGRADIDVIAKNLIEGIIARPLLVFFFAFIISLFSKKKTKDFNSVCTVVMAILTFGQLLRWIVIIGSGVSK